MTQTSLKHGTFADGGNPAAAPLVQLTPFSQMDDFDGDVLYTSGVPDTLPRPLPGDSLRRMHSLNGSTIPLPDHSHSQTPNSIRGDAKRQELAPEDMHMLLYSGHGLQESNRRRIFADTDLVQVGSPALSNRVQDWDLEYSSGCDPAGPPPPVVGTPPRPVQEWNNTCAMWVKGVEFVGHDLPGPLQKAERVNDCQAECERREGCNAVTFIFETHLCLLKNLREGAEFTNTCAAVSILMCEEEESTDPGKSLSCLLQSFPLL